MLSPKTDYHYRYEDEISIHGATKFGGHAVSFHVQTITHIIYLCHYAASIPT